MASAMNSGPELGELPEGGDPLECGECVVRGDVCEYHRGWADGWDACTELVARVVEHQRGAGEGDGGGGRG